MCAGVGELEPPDDPFADAIPEPVRLLPAVPRRGYPRGRRGRRPLQQQQPTPSTAIQGSDISADPSSLFKGLSVHCLQLTKTNTLLLRKVAYYFLLKCVIVLLKILLPKFIT